MCTTLAWIVALTLAQSEVAPSPVREISVQRRQPLALLLSTPSGVGGQTRTSHLLDAVTRLAQAHTDFFVQTLSTQKSAECEGRLACIVQQARPDYQRIQYDLGNGDVAPFSEHLDYLKQKSVVYPKYLLVLTSISGERSDRLAVTLVDTNRVLAVIHERGPVREDTATAIALGIREDALLVEPQWHEVTSAEQATAFLARTFGQDLRAQFDPAGHWQPYGTIEIVTDRGGHEIHLDGVAVGSTNPGRTHLTGVSAGGHQVRLSAPGLHPWRSKVEVPAQGIATLKATVLVASNPQALAARQITQWSGVGLMLAGVVITSVAVASQDPGVVTYCVQGTQNCAGDRFTSINYDPSQAPTTGRGLNPDGVLLGPLGYSLMLTGTAWSLATLLFDDDTEMPWWQIGAGLAVGALSYGLSAALNPQSPSN